MGVGIVTGVIACSGAPRTNAIVAAMREVELLIISDHLEAGMEFAVDSKDKDAAVKDMMTVLRSALRR